MQINSINIPIYGYHSNVKNNKNAYKKMSVQCLFCSGISSFKGKSVQDKIGIIPSAQGTDLEINLEKRLGVNPIPTEVKKFKNGETYVNISGNVRGKDVYIMPPSGDNVNERLMETYLKADAAKRAGANKVIAVMPNFDYARQERRTKVGEPITARLNMDLLKTSGVDGIITTDLHTPAIEGFASNDMNIVHLDSIDVMKDYIQKKQIPSLVIVSPDMGGMKRVDKLAKELDCDKAVVYKHRQAHNEATAECIIGDVAGKNCILYDDMIDTAGTIAAAARLLKKKGANDIYVCASHGLFNGDAMKKLQDAPIKEVIVTNSVEKKPNSIEKIKQVDISFEIAKAMQALSQAG